MSRLEAGGDGAWSARADTSWYQGSGAYGGLQGAWLVRALEAQPEVAGLRLRTLSVQCCARVVEGPVTARAEVLRRGRSVVHAAARLTQEGVVAAATATFGAPRAEGPVIHSPAAPAPALLPPFPAHPLFPAFVQHVEHRFAEGCVPYTGAAEGRMAGRARFRGGATVDAAMLVALSDVWPPAALVTFDRPRQVVTVDWRTDLLDVPAAPPDAWWTWESRTTAGADGYLVQDGWMWGPDGDLVLHGRQMLAVVG